MRPPNVNELIMSSIGDASYLNPILAQDSASSDINSFVFNGLIKYNKDLDGFVGELAESWKIEKGPEPVITFFLRKGVLWHDGKEFTADDVKFTYEKIMDAKDQYGPPKRLRTGEKGRGIGSLYISGDLQTALFSGIGDLGNGYHPETPPRKRKTSTPPHLTGNPSGRVPFAL